MANRPTAAEWKTLESALITVVQMVVKLQPHHLDAALTEMDLSNEAFEEDLATVKEAIEWEDEEGFEDEPDEDDWE